jgi:hypothetical protein
MCQIARLGCQNVSELDARMCQNWMPDCQIWMSGLDARLGSPDWMPELDARIGCPDWDVRIGCQNWMPELDVRIGMPESDVPM